MFFFIDISLLVGDDSYKNQKHFDSYVSSEFKGN